MGVREGGGFEPLLARIRAAAQAGVDWIQIREKDLAGRELEALVNRAVREVRSIGSSPARVIVNDRLDVAIAAGADGVHLGEQSIAVRDVAQFRERAKMSREFFIGASSHSVQGAVAAAEDGADYVFFGPVFATPSKAEFGPPQGLDRLAEVCRRVRVPVLAIGGVTVENAAHCAEAGAAGVAAIRMFQGASEPALPGIVAGMRGSR
jgi:thiamine-phosphate pyrophosphorylase